MHLEINTYFKEKQNNIDRSQSNFCTEFIFKYDFF